MNKLPEIIRIPAAPDLTVAGLMYLTRGLVRPGGQSFGSGFGDYREVVAQKMAELAFRRYLVEQEIPHRLVRTLTVASLDANEVSLGGRRAALITKLIFHKQEINRVENNSQRLLAAKVVRPHSFDRKKYHEDDLVIVGFVTAEISRNHKEIKEDQKEQKKLSLLYQIPEPWSHPKVWRAADKISLKTEIKKPLEIVIGGLDKEHRFLTERLNLTSNETVNVRKAFFSLNYLQAEHLPVGTIELSNSLTRDKLRINPAQWGNLWVYGINIYLVGFITQSEFANRANPIYEDSPVLGPIRSTTAGLAISADQLNPIQELFSRLKNWDKNRFK